MECPKLFTHNKEEQKWMQKVKKAMNSLSTKTWLLTPVSQRDLMRNVYTVFIARASFAEAEEWFATVWSCGLRWCILMCLFVAVCFFDPCCTIAVWHVCVVCVCCVLWLCSNCTWCEMWLRKQQNYTNTVQKYWKVKIILHDCENDFIGCDKTTIINLIG